MGAGEVMSAPLDGGAVLTLASGLTSPSPIAVSHTGVYWADSSAIMMTSLDGGSITTLVQGTSSIPLSASAIAVDDTNLYWSCEVSSSVFLDPGILAVPLAGGTPTVLGFTSEAILDIAVDATSVYWSPQSDDGPVLKAPK